MAFVISVVALSEIGCGSRPGETGTPNPERSRSERDYRLLRSELALAETDSLYMVLDFPRDRIALRLEGVPVWSAPMGFAREDSIDVARFVEHFMGGEDRLIRALVWKHLYAGKDKIPPQTLEVVSKAINAAPGALQRLVPERFLICLGDALFMEVQTDVEGTSVSHHRNFLASARRAWGLIFGGVSLRLSIDGDDGLTLYDSVYAGMPVLLILPSYL